MPPLILLRLLDFQRPQKILRIPRLRATVRADHSVRLLLLCRGRGCLLVRPAIAATQPAANYAIRGVKHIFLLSIASNSSHCGQVSAYFFRNSHAQETNSVSERAYSLHSSPNFTRRHPKQTPDIFFPLSINPPFYFLPNSNKIYLFMAKK